MVDVDPYRAILFPNRLRDLRKRGGYETLLLLAENLPQIPYIRLSKIERGEVFAKAEELRLIADHLDIEPEALLIDISENDFDMGRWSEQRGQNSRVDWREEQRAIMLAALFRRTRQSDGGISLQRLDQEYGLPPVIVSRIENAIKPPRRWNADTLGNICRVIGVEDVEMLEARLQAALEEGLLSDWLGRVPGRDERERKTVAKVEELRLALLASPYVKAERADEAKDLHRSATIARLPVIGSPLPNGLLSPTPSGIEVDKPSRAGANAFGLRLCRQTLGAGMPANSVLVVDPDILPCAGELAVLREGEALRVVSLSGDRHGALIGYSVNPSREIDIDALPSENVYAVLAIYFV